MSNLKTALVVALLLAVLYGVYTILNLPDPKPPKDFTEQEQGEMTLDIDSGESESGSDDRVSQASPRRKPTTRASFERSRKKSSSMTRRSTSSENRQVDVELPDNASSDAVQAVIPPPELKSKYSGSDSRTEPIEGPIKEPIEKLLPSFSDARAASRAQPQDPQNAKVAPFDRVDRERDSTDASQESPDADSASDSIVHDPEVPRVQNNPFVNQSKKNPGLNIASEYARRKALQQALADGRRMITEQRYREALLVCSVAFETPGLSGEDRVEFLELLDPLAAKVIYSNEHLLEPGYSVRRGDALATLAQRYNVPEQLLHFVNGIPIGELPTPGSTLKVVRGPFSATVNLAAGEITLYLQRYYAGRFPVSFGHDPGPITGEFEVRGKETEHPYYMQGGNVIAAGDPTNPYGRCWIDLGRDVVIHGSSLTDDNSHLGCISLSPKDAEDVYAILSVGSKVTIVR